MFAQWILNQVVWPISFGAEVPSHQECRTGGWNADPFVNHGCHDPDHILLCKPHRYDSERWFDCGYGLAIYRLLSTWYLRTFRVAGLLRFVFPYDIKFCSQKASRKTWSWKNPIDTPHLCQVQNAWWWWWLLLLLLLFLFFLLLLIIDDDDDDDLYTGCVRSTGLCWVVGSCFIAYQQS